MRRFRLFAAVFLVPVLAFLLGTLGCSSDKDKGGGGPESKKDDTTPAAEPWQFRDQLVVPAPIGLETLPGAILAP